MLRRERVLWCKQNACHLKSCLPSTAQIPWQRRTLLSVLKLNLKLSTPCVLAVTQLFLFQLNSLRMFNAHIYYQLPPACFSVFCTNFRETIALLAQKLYVFGNGAVKCTIYPGFYIYNIVTAFKTICISFFCTLKVIKILVKILNCSTLTF